MEKGKKMTMEERIQAFYKQSGGPGNPDIERILEHHLLYGKDHGMKGKKETVQDALRDALTEDKSTSLIIDWLAEKKIERMSRQYQKEERYSQMGKEIGQGLREGIEVMYNKRIDDLEVEVTRLRELVLRLTARLEEVGIADDNRYRRFHGDII
ncbi:hypothetical protein [Aneurinibacillus tyrosinisolvens]|jgi:hypothetical protein|uniref:hypothetical protein n=1 Tax=Aneurinibacillus tyrosinisolvens TaxID=1443435 RepID=UPI00063FA591|nr:hypothetical protein [Aneurinibacillus tyrosinisolvens]